MTKKWFGGIFQKAVSSSSRIKVNSQSLPPQLLKQEQTVTQSTEDQQEATTEVLPSSEANYKPGDIQLDITKKLPAEVAILHIYACGSEKYRVLGKIDKFQELSTEPEEPPDLSLGKLVTSNKLPADIRGIIHFCSFRKLQVRKVLDWLIKLHNAFEQIDKQFYLIIADHTDFEIPWEMLKLAQNKHLGAVIATTRWQYICPDEGSDGNQNLLLEVKPDKCYGNVMSYINRKLNAEAIEIELSILRQLNALDFDDIDKFLKSLCENQPDFGLIFISCHGYFGEDVLEIKLAEDKGKRLVGLMELYNWELNLLRYSQAIVFINACHSGRLRQDKKYTRNRDYRTGFATFFLEKGAQGVIGTLGTVGNMCAAKIARSLIEECQSNSNLSVAELLRRARAQAVEKLLNDDTQEARDTFLYTFMYVYYGNPMTVLRLTPSGGQLNV